jgi:hypothetical protein
MGGLAGQGVNLAMGGDFTLNVLNLGGFTDNEMNLGLLEMHFGGEEIFGGFKIGTEGANVSVSSLKYALPGAAHSSEILAAKIDNLMGSPEKLSVLNGINKLAYLSTTKEERDIVDELFNGDFKSIYEEIRNRNLIDEDKIHFIVGNTADTSEGMATILAELMHNKKSEQAQREAAELPREKYQEIVEGANRIAEDTARFFDENDKSDVDSILASVERGLDIFNVDEQVINFLTSRGKNFYDEFMPAYNLFKKQQEQDGNSGNMNNDFLLWNNEPQKDMLYALENGIEFLESYYGLRVPFLTGVKFTTNNFEVNMSSLIQGIDLQANYFLPTKNIATILSGGFNYSWTKNFTANAGISFSIPLPGGSMSISNDIEFNNEGNFEYESKIKGVFSY